MTVCPPSRDIVENIAPVTDDVENCRRRNDRRLRKRYRKKQYRVRLPRLVKIRHPLA